MNRIEAHVSSTVSDSLKEKLSEGPPTSSCCRWMNWSRELWIEDRQSWKSQLNAAPKRCLTVAPSFSCRGRGNTDIGRAHPCKVLANGPYGGILERILPWTCFKQFSNINFETFLAWTDITWKSDLNSKMSLLVPNLLWKFTVDLHQMRNCPDSCRCSLTSCTSSPGLSVLYPGLMQYMRLMKYKVHEDTLALTESCSPSQRRSWWSLWKHLHDHQPPLPSPPLPSPPASPPTKLSSGPWRRHWTRYITSYSWCFRLTKLTPKQKIVLVDNYYWKWVA